MTDKRPSINRGVVCSVFRLVDTIQLSTQADVLYYTGPVMLWCTAEITCGFFVACAPILPRVAKETPGLRHIFPSTKDSGAGASSRNLGIQTIGGTGGPPRQRVGKGGKPDAYYSQIDDDGDGMMALDDLKGSAGSDSTENLRHAAPQPGTSVGGIVRTTHVSVTRSEDREHAFQSASTVDPPWVRR